MRTSRKSKVTEIDPFAQLRALPPPTVEEHRIDATKIDPLVTFMQRTVWNIQVARTKREEARHLKVKVGAVVAGSLADGTYIEAITANENLGRGSGPTKKCAEQTAINRLTALGVVVVHGMVVVGNHQPDTQSGIEGVTLHVCGECRDYASDHELVADNVPIVSASPYRDAYEVYDLSELKAVHAYESSPTDPEKFKYDRGFSNLQRNVDFHNPYAAGVVELADFSSAADMIRQTFHGSLADLSMAS